MRVIIRFSLNGSNRSQNRLRQALKGHLEAHGITWTGKSTSTYEGDVKENDIKLALRHFWAEAAVASAHVDHFWMYADRHSPPALFNLPDLGR